MNLDIADPRLIVQIILKEESAHRKKMLFGLYKKRLSDDQIQFLVGKSAGVLLEAQKLMGGTITTPFGDQKDLWYDKI